MSIVCPDCGEENGEGAKFCKKCGTALEVQSSSIFSSEPKAQSKSKRNIIIIAIAAGIAAGALMGLFSGFMV